MVKKNITVVSPGKLMILGEHAVVYGYPCIVTAVDGSRSLKVTVQEAKNDRIDAPNVSDTRFVQEARDVVRKELGQTISVHIKTQSTLGGFGLGSSAAVVVATVTALTAFFGKPFTKRQLFDLCYKAIRAVEKRVSGFDVAACIFGGTVYFDGKTKNTTVLTTELLPLVIGFSGSKASTPVVVERVRMLRQEHPQFVHDVFDSIATLVERGRRAIHEKDLERLGNCMNQSHELLQTLKISTTILDEMVDVAQKAGAYGAKLSGAGGGDCMIALVESSKNDDVVYAIRSVGRDILSVTTSSQGVHVV